MPKEGDKERTGGGRTRADRLAEELRRNLARRKQQARERARDEGEPSPGGEDRDEADA